MAGLILSLLSCLSYVFCIIFALLSGVGYVMFLLKFMKLFVALFIIASFICFLWLVFILKKLLLITQQLPDKITVEQGSVTEQLSGALLCTIIMGLATAAAQSLIMGREKG